MWRSSLERCGSATFFINGFIQCYSGYGNDLLSTVTCKASSSSKLIYHNYAVGTKSPFTSAHARRRSSFAGNISNSATIDFQDLPTHPATRLCAQEKNDVCDLLWGADTICGAEAGNHLEHLLRLSLVEELCGDGPRRDGVDADALTHEVLGHDADHLLDGTFGGAVEKIARHDIGGCGDGGRKKNDMGSGGHVWESFLQPRVSIIEAFMEKQLLARRIPL